MEQLFEMLGQEVFVTFLSIVVSVLGVGLTWLSKNASDYIKEKVGNEHLQKLINRANEVVVTSVKAAMQEEVEDLKKKAGEDGLNKDDARKIKTRVVNKIMAKLGDKSLQELENSFGDARSYIEDKVEATVKDVKEGKK